MDSNKAEKAEKELENVKLPEYFKKDLLDRLKLSFWEETEQINYIINKFIQENPEKLELLEKLTSLHEISNEIHESKKCQYCKQTKHIIDPEIDCEYFPRRRIPRPFELESNKTSYSQACIKCQSTLHWEKYLTSVTVQEFLSHQHYKTFICDMKNQDKKEEKKKDLKDLKEDQRKAIVEWQNQEGCCAVCEYPMCAYFTKAEESLEELYCLYDNCREKVWFNGKPVWYLFNNTHKWIHMYCLQNQILMKQLIKYHDISEKILFGLFKKADEIKTNEIKTSEETLLIQEKYLDQDLKSFVDLWIEKLAIQMTDDFRFIKFKLSENDQLLHGKMICHPSIVNNPKYQNILKNIWNPRNQRAEQQHKRNEEKKAKRVEKEKEAEKEEEEGKKRTGGANHFHKKRKIGDYGKSLLAKGQTATKRTKTSTTYYISILNQKDQK